MEYKPETIEELKARYPAALERIWTLEQVAAGDRPGLERKYVFDFPDGLRMIISKTEFEDKVVREHLSVSWCLPLAENASLISLMKQIHKAFADLGGKGHLHLIGVSDGSIPHFIVEKLN